MEIIPRAKIWRIKVVQFYNKAGLEKSFGTFRVPHYSHSWRMEMVMKRKTLGCDILIFPSFSCPKWISLFLSGFFCSPLSAASPCLSASALKPQGLKASVFGVDTAPNSSRESPWVSGGPRNFSYFLELSPVPWAPRLPRVMGDSETNLALKIWRDFVKSLIQGRKAMIRPKQTGEDFF